MAPLTAELGVRLQHLRALLFTEWTALGTVLAVLCWVARGRASLLPLRDGLLVVLGVAVVWWMASPWIAAATLAGLVAFHAAVELGPGPAAGTLVGALLAGLLVAPVLAVGALGELGRHAREFVAFATNILVLRCWAYLWDRWRGTAQRLPALRFLVATLFFPTFVNGPIEAPRRMEVGWTAEEAGARRRDAAAGLLRVAGGVAKLVLVAVAFRPGWTAGFGALRGAAAPALWLWGVALYVWFYLSFSAWSDVAIGLSRLCGRRVPENFFAPWRATDPADFWRRWHVSLGLWLRDYVYIPLGGKRRHRAVNVLVVFLVSAAWHIWGATKLLGLGYFPPRAWGGFLLWGALNAAGVLAARPLDRVLPATSRGRVVVRCTVTTLFAAMTWVPFFLPPDVPVGTAVRLLGRMLWPGLTGH